MIRVESLTKTYAGVRAVDDISFEVQEHEILGFLGPNGAGKTTTLRILAGYLSATSGQVIVDGHDVFNRPEAVKRVIGYMPESVPLYPELRVGEYLRYRAGLKKVPRGRTKRAVGDAIERCRLGDVEKRIIGQLSKGYRQRVGLADALVGDPKILILDEPTIGLDPNQIRQVRDLVRELGKERTVILSSHILPEVEAVCSRVQIIHKGRLVSQGRPDELRAGLAGSGVSISVEVLDPAGLSERILGAVAGVKSIAAVKTAGGGRVTYGIAADADEPVRERIFDAAAGGGFKLLGLASRKVSLEEVFVELTTSGDAADPERTGGEGGAQ